MFYELYWCWDFFFFPAFSNFLVNLIRERSTTEKELFQMRRVLMTRPKSMPFFWTEMLLSTWHPSFVIRKLDVFKECIFPEAILNQHKNLKIRSQGSLLELEMHSYCAQFLLCLTVAIIKLHTLSSTRLSAGFDLDDSRLRKAAWMKTTKKNKINIIKIWLELYEMGDHINRELSIENISLKIGWNCWLD